MAIDTRNERAGAQGKHIHPLQPSGNGTIDQADRQMIVGVYPGVLAGGAPTGIVVLRRRREGA
ncbi:MAG: hypothetical protein ACXABY_07370 [Candidatus Thorarchaeota archaeon]|jgi:hypothetical protein